MFQELIFYKTHVLLTPGRRCMHSRLICYEQAYFRRQG